MTNPNGFGTDQVLLYNVSPWNKLGFGVPNFGNNQSTVNQPLARLADEIGLAQCQIMTHVDTLRRSPPSRNTMERLGKMLNRLKTVLLNRKRDYNELRLEAGHGTPQKIFWKIHPVPFFGDAVVRNSWLEEYNQLCMLILTNAFQATDNNVPLDFTPELAGLLWSFGARIQSLIGVELLGLTRAEVETDDFRFTAEHFNAYDPTTHTVNLEAISSPVHPDSMYTEDDISQFVQGIPSNLIAPNLARYPSYPEGEAIGTPTSEPGPEQNPGTDDGSAISPVI